MPTIKHYLLRQTVIDCRKISVIQQKTVPLHALLKNNHLSNKDKVL